MSQPLHPCTGDSRVAPQSSLVPGLQGTNRILSTPAPNSRELVHGLLCDATLPQKGTVHTRRHMYPDSGRGGPRSRVPFHALSLTGGPRAPLPFSGPATNCRTTGPPSQLTSGSENKTERNKTDSINQTSGVPKTTPHPLPTIGVKQNLSYTRSSVNAL